MVKQLQETYEQIEMAHIEKETFQTLKTHEEAAIPKRLEVYI